MEFQKLKTNIIVYRDNKNFDNAKFKYDIVTATSHVDNFGVNENIVFDIFHRHVQKKYIRTNEAPFI